MPISRRRVVAAAAGLAILAPSRVLGFPDERAGARARPIASVAGPPVLKPGTRCRIEVEERPPTAFRSVVTTYEGIVVEADGEGVCLDVREVRREHSVPAAMRLPFSDRLFRNVGIGRLAPGEKHPPLAIAAAKIRSVTVLPAGTPGAAQPGRLSFVPPPLPWEKQKP
ncbi:hypothetical protein OJF2_74090 [Aquisphaera giovannonii]|uniref:Tat pathway signal sequence domain protein n=1 Tax=Aquisphaera giovannonii TaxID=406548 RepID=A0A5B9WEX2_9BACT|nr:hypothetical protein [Aquisphaera giovannonii]QEH38799.1 hypothetical protein OJF2_74090 [Aquisphaera giovannonii]